MTRPQPKVPQSAFSKVKDAALFAGGFTGMALEVAKVFSQEPRTIFVGVYLLMLGLPVFTGIDRLFQRAPDPTLPPPPTPEDSST